MASVTLLIGRRVPFDSVPMMMANGSSTSAYDAARGRGVRAEVPLGPSLSGEAIADGW